MLSIFGTTWNLEIDAPPKLEYLIDQGLKFMEIDKKDATNKERNNDSQENCSSPPLE
ncbi:MAG: hypothetical protein M2R45_02261 [Verrucomicrobia subdivision 3 bacterium]|nr:hypothetical protein [Limisphaerales bacterium]MCS1413953.1 hypothetical protein [Limisphaerales bacterium]